MQRIDVDGNGFFDGNADATDWSGGNGFCFDY